MADDITHYDAVEGYVLPDQRAPGEPALLRVVDRGARGSTSRSTAGVPTRELVWSAERRRRASPSRHRPTPTPPVRLGAGGRDPHRTDWRSGFYLVTLTAHDAPADRAVAHAGFVVRARHALERRSCSCSPPTPGTPTTTGAARSLYTGGHEVVVRPPVGPRACSCGPRSPTSTASRRHASPATQPDVDGDAYQAFRFAHGFPGYMGSAGWFTYDRRFVEWAEARRLRARLRHLERPRARSTGSTDGYRLVIGAGHDEYWSAGGRDTVEAFVAGGGNYASFSGNTMFWQVRLERDGRSMVCHKYAAAEHDPVVASEPTRDDRHVVRPGGRPARAPVPRRGARCSGSTAGSAGRRRAACRASSCTAPDHWLLDGTGLRYGDVLGDDDGVVGYETVGTRYRASTRSTCRWR